MNSSTANKTFSTPNPEAIYEAKKKINSLNFLKVQNLNNISRFSYYQRKIDAIRNQILNEYGIDIS